MKSYRTPTDSCPACGHILTRAAGTVRRPQAGDLSLCWYCHELLVFTWDLKLRKATKADLDGLTGEEQADLLQKQKAMAQTLEKLTRR